MVPLYHTLDPPTTNRNLFLPFIYNTTISDTGTATENRNPLATAFIIRPLKEHVLVSPLAC
ncbi:hypothetical protein E2C01_033710 [Portunus trituberculatus]|uniref:Uncharacterized protein n=1 Tax=Portunus trituberculatus TaxID=210409 RepID=A0A5B7F3E0_PORTR|nr:hypothetical protein [Portunus trituberculatus]